MDSPGSSRRRRRRRTAINNTSSLMQNKRNSTSNVNDNITNRQEQIDDIMEFSDNDEQQIDNNPAVVAAQPTLSQEDTNTQNDNMNSVENPTDMLLSALQNSNTINWNVIIPSLLTSISATNSTSTNTAATQQQKIPIRIRLATSHSNSSTDQTNTTQEVYKSYERTSASSKLTTIFPPPVPLNGTTTTAVSTTISNYTQYIVEELFINNREDIFQHYDDEEHQVLALFNNILPNINRYNVIVSYYGKRMNRRMKKVIKSIIIDKSSNTQDVNNSSTTSTAAKKPKCEIHFTLVEQLESNTTQGNSNGRYLDLNGDQLAYETLHEMYISNDGNILDLILMANVIYPTSSSSPHTTLQQQSMNVNQPVDNRKAPPEQLIQATATAMINNLLGATNKKKRKTVYDELEHSDISVASSHQRSPKRIKTGEKNNVAQGGKTSEAARASNHPSKFTLFVLCGD